MLPDTNSFSRFVQIIHFEKVHMFLRCLIRADHQLELIPSKTTGPTGLTYNIPIQMM